MSPIGRLNGLGVKSVTALPEARGASSRGDGGGCDMGSAWRAYDEVKERHWHRRQAALSIDAYEVRANLVARSILKKYGIRRMSDCGIAFIVYSSVPYV